MLFFIDSTWKLSDTTKALKLASEELTKPMEGLEIKFAHMLIGQNRVIMLVEAENTEVITNMHWPFLDHVQCKWYPAIEMADAFKKLGE